MRCEQLVRASTGEIVGALVPDHAHDAAMLRERKIRKGELVSIEIYRVRNPKFNRYVHAIGQLCIQHIEQFENYTDAHAVIKRLQIESKTHCDEVAIQGGFICYIPRSLSFDNMDESEFNAFVNAICKFICKRYWPEMEPEQVEQMALAMEGQ